MSDSIILDTPTDDDTTATFRPLVFSVVAPGRPVHALRAGTFTDMHGRDTTFTPADLAAIAGAFSKRRRLPINEQHDMGRAVGRIAQVWATDTDLYFEPHWNAEGQRLLADEVYDMISVELSRDNHTKPWALIGAALTNYPAVDGLAPVRLSAPQPDVVIPESTSRAGGASAHTETIMPEDTPTIVSETPPAAPPMPPISETVMDARMQSYAAEMERRYAAAQDVAMEKARLAFERKIAEMQMQQEVESYTQHITTPTITRQYALPGDASAYSTFMFGLNTEQRKQARALFDSILSAGLVSFEEIGSAREGDDAADGARLLERVDTIVAQKVATGMGRTDALSFAIKTVGRDAYNAAKAAAQTGGR